jgi:signal transduction histidine kinase
VLELNQEFIGRTLIPEMLNRYLGGGGKIDYSAEVTTDGNPPVLIYGSESQLHAGYAPNSTSDAVVKLLDILPIPPESGGFVGRSSASPSPDLHSDTSPPDAGRGLWVLRVHHHTGSLETIVAHARLRNIFLSASILLLILATAGALLRFSRQAQQIATLQMNFVAGVSHELRTPLAVIRTAAYNLRGDFARQPDQVTRYGALIQRETEKLSALVQQVLRYGSARAGRALQQCAPVAIDELIETSLASIQAAAHEKDVRLEKRIEPDLPGVLGDEEALRHALQNLLDNALKHGTKINRWIGVFAQASPNGSTSAVEIHVADRGPGIPTREQRSIFDSFFRGQLPLNDQIHGTGLGLALVKKIVEAHGGTVRVQSRPGEGAEFILRIPAASPGARL